MTTAPAKRRERPTRPLPDSELVSLIDDPDGPYAGSPAGWWTQYGGGAGRGLGSRLPPRPDASPSPFHPEECPNCIPRWRSA